MAQKRPAMALGRTCVCVVGMGSENPNLGRGRYKHRGQQHAEGAVSKRSHSRFRDQLEKTWTGAAWASSKSRNAFHHSIQLAGHRSGVRL